MRNQIKYILVTAIAVVFTACELVVDLTTNDAIDTFSYTIDNTITQIALREDMDLELVESEDSQLVITGPKALLDNFSIKKDTGLLTLTFDKMGSWKYDKPLVQMRMPSIHKINLYAHNNLFANDTLRADTINIYNDGTGDVKLSVNCNHFIVKGTLIGIFYINGKTDSLTIDNYYSSSFRGADLVAQNIKVTTQASNDQVVYPVKSMTCNMSQTGNVYYVNEPEELIINYLNGKTGRAMFDPNHQ